MALLYRGQPYTLSTSRVVLPDTTVRYRGRQLSSTPVRVNFVPVRFQFLGRTTTFAMA